MSFTQSRRALTALNAALSAPLNKADRSAQEFLKRTKNWEQMLTSLEKSGQYDWLDLVLAPLLTHFQQHLQSYPASQILSQPQHSSYFGAIHGLLRAELSHKRKEYEAFAELRNRREIEEAERISSAVSLVPTLEASSNELVELVDRARTNSEGIEQVYEKMRQLEESASSSKDTIETLVTEAKDTAEAALAEAKENAAEFSLNAKSASEKVLTDAIKRQEEITSTQTEIDEAKQTADISAEAINKQLSELENQRTETLARLLTADGLLKTKSDELAQATDMLKSARADLNRQGLADAFATRAQELKTSRRWIDFLFCLLTVFVPILSIWLKFKYGQSFEWGNWLATIAPLSLVVWLGWQLASRSDSLSRLIEDYEFKTATALAFQGYKLELDGDPALLKKLLEKTISNFGANPTRLMPQPKNVPTTPIEAAFDKVGAIARDAGTAVKDVKGSILGG